MDFGLPRLVQPGAAGPCALVQQAANIILQTGSARTVASTRAKGKRIDLDFRRSIRKASWNPTEGIRTGQLNKLDSELLFP